MSEGLRVLVVDDERAAREHIRHVLTEHAPDVERIRMCDGGAAAVDAIASDEPHVVFLDVQMPGIDGFGMIGRVGADHMPVTIFVTAHESFAVRAFEENALDFLLKPFSDERLLRAFERARRRVAERRAGDLSGLLQWLRSTPEAAAAGEERPPHGGAPLERLLVPSRGRTLVVPVESIDWIEADGPYAELHVGPATHLVRMSMSGLEQRLDRSRFVRIHRSTIVSLDRVVALEELARGEFVVLLRSGARLKLSRGRRLAFEQAMGQRL